MITQKRPLSSQFPTGSKMVGEKNYSRGIFPITLFRSGNDKGGHPIGREKNFLEEWPVAGNDGSHLGSQSRKIPNLLRF